MMAVPRRCPQCLELVKGRCVKCNGEREKKYDAKRGTAASRGYDADWRRFRKQVLIERPLCEDCHAAGRVKAACEVHHIVKLRTDPSLRLEPSNVMSLCKSCHSKRTYRGE